MSPLRGCLGSGPDADHRWMGLALHLAERGLGQTAPNPAVGAVIVRHAAQGDVVVGRGWTQKGGRPHAETGAIIEAGTAAQGATLYVTLEPCAHHGRTPPCAEAVIAAGIGRVVIGMIDPDPRVAGRGRAMLEAAGIAVETGVRGSEAQWLTLGHTRRVQSGRPFVQVKLAVSANGLLPLGHPGQGPVWVTGRVARARVHGLRAQADAVLIGIGTALTDDPALTCRLPGLHDRSPIRVVLDTHLRLPLTSQLVRTARSVPVWLVCAATSIDTARSGELSAAGVTLLPWAVEGEKTVAARSIQLGNALQRLADRGMTRVLVEAGPTLARSFADAAGLVDEWIIITGAAEIDPRRGAALAGLWPSVRGQDWVTVPVERLGPDRLERFRRVFEWRASSHLPVTIEPID